MRFVQVKSRTLKQSVNQECLMSMMTSCSVMGLKIPAASLPSMVCFCWCKQTSLFMVWGNKCRCADTACPHSRTFCSGVEPVCVQSERMESCVVRRRVVASRTWPGNINKLGEGEMEPMSLAQSFGASAHPDARLPLCQAPFLLPIHRHEN